MGAIRCVFCGSSAVDHEGYCWACERHNEVAGPPPPGWIVPGEDLMRDLPVAPPSRDKIRIGKVIIPPAVAFVVMVLGMGGYFAFRTADALMTAPPASLRSASASTSGARSAVQSCVIGTWHHVAIDEMITFKSAPVHVTGSGGRTTFAADGTGVEDYTGRVVTGTSDGRAVAFQMSGSMNFRYTITGKQITFKFSVSQVAMSITVGGVTSPGEYTVRDGTLTVACGADTLKLFTKSGGSVTSQRAG